MLRRSVLVGIGVMALLGCGDDRAGTSETRRDGDTRLPPVAGGRADGSERQPESSARTSMARSASAAWAQLEPVSGAGVGEDARGTVRFEASGDGLRVRAELEGLEPGVHGMHVHEGNDCAAPGSHFAFGATAQGEEAGDLGDVRADSTGRVEFEGVVRNAKLEGTRSIVGHSVVLHAASESGSGETDTNAPAAVACGVIRSGTDVSSLRPDAAPLRGRSGTKP